MTRLSDVNEGINQALESGDGRFDSVDVHGATLRAGDVSSNLTPAASVAGWSNGKTPAVIEVVGMAAGNAPVKDSPLVGDEGVSSAQANPQGSSDSQINQGLTIERLIHAVVMAEEHAEEIEQLRAEENDAAEEGALIDASGYNDPVYGVPR